MERIRMLFHMAAIAAFSLVFAACVPMSSSSTAPLYGTGATCNASDIGARIACPGNDPAAGICVYQWCDSNPGSPTFGLATACTRVSCTDVPPPYYPSDGSTGCTPGAERLCTGPMAELGSQLCDVSGNWMMCQVGTPFDAGTPPMSDGGTGCDSDPLIGTACTVGTGECAANGAWACVSNVRECVLNPGQSVGTPTSETCDNLDNDCDGMIDEAVTRTCYSGPAGTRGVGICTPGIQACSTGTWGSCMGEVLPATEIPDNAIDEDCNGGLLFSVSCGGDARVGTGCSAGIGACMNTGSWSCLGNELLCNAVPGTPMPEICDNLDNDCNGLTDESLLRSFYTGPAGTAMVGICRVGYEMCAAGLWMPNAPEVLPMTEVCGDGIDQNCNGHDDACPACGGDPRITTPPIMCSVGMGLCTASGVWACDTGSVRCTASPGAAVDEICDNLDQDCDGAVDEDLVQTCYSGDMRQADVGLCHMGTRTCAAGLWSVCTGEMLPTTEICDNGLDEDCNGSDLRCGTACGSDPRVTTPPTACTVGTGACSAFGVFQCTSGTVACSATPSMPTAELCNAIDDNCNGVIDEAPGGGAIVRSCYPFTTGLPGVGVCRSGSQTCMSGVFAACTGAVGPSTEICDGLDNDCDGGADEGGVCGPPPAPDAGTDAAVLMTDAGMDAGTGTMADAGAGAIDSGIGMMSTDSGGVGACTSGGLCIMLSSSVNYCPTGGSIMVRDWDNTGGDVWETAPPLDVPVSATGISINPWEYLNNTLICRGTGVSDYYSPVLVSATVGALASSIGISVTLNGVDVTSSVRICWDTERPDRTNTTALSFHRIQIAARTSSLLTACFGTTGS